MRRNLYEVTVISCDPRDSHAWLLLGKTRIAARRWAGIRRGQRARARIRAEDVLLSLGHPGPISARNVMPGHVRKVAFIPDGVAVTLDVGFPLTALVTRAAQSELGLRRGKAVYAIVKATAIAPVDESPKSFRVSLVGRGGILAHERIDFLRAVKEAGSLSAAARDRGITYRTAWLWAEECNRAWRAPLLERSHGGRGGGGTTLTPEGHAVLERADRLERDAAHA